MLVRINLEGGIVFQIGPKMSQFLVENCNSFIHAWSKIDFKKGPKMVQKWSKMVQKLSMNRHFLGFSNNVERP